MELFAILTVGFVSAAIGRSLFGRWFNHVVIYSFLWTASIALFELRLMDYYRLDTDTWIVVGIGWISFVLGSALYVAFRRSAGRTSMVRPAAPRLDAARIEELERDLRMIIIVFSVIAAIGVLEYWYVLINRYGSILGVFIYGSILYRERLAEGIKGSIPYLDSLALAATLLSAVYCGLKGRFRLLSLFPLLFVILADVALMGRTRMIFSAFLFPSVYILTRDALGLSSKRSRHDRFRLIASLAIVLALFAAGAELVRGERVVENFKGETTALKQLHGAMFITPSIYMYATVHIAVLNQYLKHEDLKTLFGENSLAPMYRILTKLGFDTNIREYQEFYNTPVGANTSTYLGELRADYGLAGILVLPFLLGFVCAVYWFRLASGHPFSALAVIGHLYGLVGFTLFFVPTRSGTFWISFFAAVVVGRWLDRRYVQQPLPVLAGTGPGDR